MKEPNYRSAYQSYTRALRSLTVGDSHLRELNARYVSLIVDMYRCFHENSSFNRQDEFLLDFQLFADDMRRKYSTSNPYGYTPRSPMEKKKGLPPKSVRDKEGRLSSVRSPLDDGDDLSL